MSNAEITTDDRFLATLGQDLTEATDPLAAFRDALCIENKSRGRSVHLHGAPCAGSFAFVEEDGCDIAEVDPFFCGWLVFPFLTWIL